MMMLSVVVVVAAFELSVIHAHCSAGPHLPCAAGCFLDSETHICTDVHAGRYSPEGDNNQYRCTSGTFSASQSESCTPCPIGHFTDAQVSAACYPCGIAQYSDVPGAKRCKACNPARYIGYGSNEAVRENGINFCVAPELTLPPTGVPTRSFRPSLSPTHGPSILETPSSENSSSGPVAASGQMVTSDMTGKPTILERPTTTASSPTTTGPSQHFTLSHALFPSASPSENPTDRPSHSIRKGTATPTFENHASTLYPEASSSHPPTRVPQTATPTTTKDRYPKQSFLLCKSLLPNIGVACIITGLACCCFISQQTDNAASAASRKQNFDEDVVLVDEEVTMGETISS